MKKLFIFGVQRSGTSILSSVIGELPEVKYYPETNAEINSENKKEGGQTIRLKKYDEVEMLFNNVLSKYKLIISKPLVESQNAAEILMRFDESIGFWNYRSPLDVVSSHIAKWNIPKPSVYFGPILNQSEDNWRSQNLTRNCIDIFHSHYDSSMSIVDAVALNWLIRNQLFFEQKLEVNEKVSLINYERLVSENDYLQNKINKVDINIIIKQQRHQFNISSMGKGSRLYISPKLAEQCEIMYSSFEDVESDNN